MPPAPPPRIRHWECIVVPAHFHDVTDDKMKSNVVKTTIRTTLESLSSQFVSENC